MEALSTLSDLFPHGGGAAFLKSVERGGAPMQKRFVVGATTKQQTVGIIWGVKASEKKEG